LTTHIPLSSKLVIMWKPGSLGSQWSNKYSKNTDTNATENSKEQPHSESTSIQSCIAQMSYTIDINVHPLIMK